MSLAVGTRLGPYEIQAAVGAGGMSACGHAGAPSAAAALGWRAEPRTSESEATLRQAQGRPERSRRTRHQRQFALGVGPQRQ